MIMAPENSQPTELINGNGDFNELGFKDFIRGAAASIPVIAIIGPQSSGKSTLLNHLFRTNFREMNAIYGRSKTTNGIWIAKAPHIEPLTVVLDLGGTDGKEKGEDDTAFEKQSALFAIAIAHTVIINMWCSDVGREHAANRPLLKIVFEALLSLLAPQKTTLHFVVRDGNNIGIPSELLKCNLKEDIEKIWEAVPKPPGNEGTLLTEIFNVEVTVLSHYIYMRHEFDEEVVQLQKQLISHNLDLSTSKISLSSAKKTWDIIKEIKGFKAPRNYRLMVATMRCEEIAMDKLRLFQSDQEWLEIEKSAKTKLVIDFGAKTKSILAKYLSEYDKETMNFESSTIGGYDQQVHKVRSSKRQDLTVKALKMVYPAYMNTLGHLRSETLQSFTTQLKARIQNFSLSAFESYRTCYDSCVLQFDLQCSEYATIEEANWKEEASTVREQLLHEIRNCTLNQLRPMELINGDGDFNESGFEDFIRGAAASIPVIAIVGPQSSGKSTLLNHLFRTNFREMNAQTGRSKTTNGIWIAKAPHTEPLTVVLDLEGTDGKEKGEDDTAFEKQSALFAIAIAHTVIINMWWSDVGREHAANRPLLKTVFEAMLSLSLYSLEKTTLHFVVRDGNNKTGTPSELLKRNLKEDIEKIWEAVPKPPGNEGTLLTDIFNVDVTVLSNYLFMRQDFDDQVVQLQKQLISHNLDPSTSKLSLSSAKKTWDTIKEFKGFKAPPYRLMFATTRCDEIAVEKLKLFQANQAWLELEENAKTQLVKDFGARTNSILTTYLFEYDNETINFESGTKGGYDQQVHEVRSNKRQDLTVKALKVVYPAYMNTLGHLRSETLRSFTTQLKARIQNFSLSAFESYQSCYDSCMLQFDQQCADYATVEHAQWKGDALSVRKQLLREIREHALNQIRDDLSISVTMEVFRVVRDVSVTDKWESIRRFMETAKLAGAGIFGGENEEIVADLEKHVRDRVVNIFKDESLNVEELIKHRFILALTPMDDNTMPTKEEAYRQCLDMLSTMAVIRLDDTYDVVQRVLRSELLMNANSGDGISLSSVTWENVPLQMTLITPLRCKQIWTNFKQKTEDCYSIAEKYEEVVHPDCTNTLGHIRSEVFRSFMTKLKARGQKFSLSAFQTCRDSCLLKFDKKCSVDATIEQDDAASVRKQLLRQMNEHALCQLRNDLSCSIITKVSKVILRDCSVEDIWDCIRLFLKSENERAKSAAVGIFGTEHKQIVSDLEQYARISVVTSVKLLFRNVEKHLKERFIDAISTSSKTMDKKEGHRQCLALLSTMAVIRLDDTYDVVHRVLNSEFLGSNRGAGTSSYPHSSHTWENVPQEMTLITPLQCEDIWTKFTQDMEHCLAIADAVVNQHQKKQDEKQDEKRPLRKWVVFGIAILGFYEFMAILICNPPAAVLFFVEVALQQGVLRKLKNKLIYSDTKEEFEKDDISKQSRFIKFLWSYMEKIYRIFRDKVLGNTFRQIYIN